MSLFGAVTTAEIRGWQCAAGLLLHELLERSHRDQLPPITWTVPDLGNLIARCPSADDWSTWLTALQLTDVRPPVVYAGRTRLRASGTLPTSRGRHVTVTLLADLHKHRASQDRDCEDHDVQHRDSTPQDAA